VKLTDKELREILAKRPGTVTPADLRWMKRDHITALSTRQIGAMPLVQVLAMSAEQVAALTQAHVAALEPQMGIVTLRPKGFAANLAKLEAMRAKSAKSRPVKFSVAIFGEPNAGELDADEPRVKLARFHPLAIIIRLAIRWLPVAWRAVGTEIKRAKCSRGRVLKQLRFVSLV